MKHTNPKDMPGPGDLGHEYHPELDQPEPPEFNEDDLPMSAKIRCIYKGRVYDSIADFVRENEGYNKYRINTLIRTVKYAGSIMINRHKLISVEEIYNKCLVDLRGVEAIKANIILIDYCVKNTLSGDDKKRGIETIENLKCQLKSP